MPDEDAEIVDDMTQEAIFIAVPAELDEPLGGRAVVELFDPDLNQ